MKKLLSILFAILFTACGLLPIQPKTDAVVVIHTESAVGTGFVINQAGCVLTAKHVVSQGREPEVIIADRPGIVPYLKYEIAIDGGDVDLAVICPKDKLNYAGPVVVFSHQTPTIGEEIVVFGEYMKHVAMEWRTGHVVDRVSLEAGPFEYHNLLRAEFEGNLMPGYSGSPMFWKGNVIGVLVVCLQGMPDEKTGQQTQMHICAAQNSDVISKFLHDNHVDHTDAG